MEIRRSGGAEQYHADKRYTDALNFAVEACAEDTECQACYICLEDGSEEGLVRGCACRGAAGYTHMSCLVRQAQIATGDLDDFDNSDAAWDKWTICGLCKQDFHGVVVNAIGWACWKTYVGFPEARDIRQSALSTLSFCICDADIANDVSVHQARYDDVCRFLPNDEDNMLTAKANLAIAYSKDGREGEALLMEREIYAKTREIYGEESEDNINTVHNLAKLLLEAALHGEARTLLRDYLAVAPRSLGSDHQETLTLRLNYAVALVYEGDDEDEETDDEQDRADYLEAERIAADVDRRAELVFGTQHPLIIEAQDTLREVRDELAATERKLTLRTRPKRARDD